MTQNLDLAYKDGKRAITYKCTLLCLKKDKKQYEHNKERKWKI